MTSLTHESCENARGTVDYNTLRVIPMVAKSAIRFFFSVKRSLARLLPMCFAHGLR